MTERLVISPADLSAIERSLVEIGEVATHVGQRLNLVEDQQAQTQSLLESLVSNFAAFVERDAKQKEVQLAETRIVKVRQELEHRFGHYGAVRRRATGILQAIDTQTVSSEAIRNTSEEMMMQAPGYWLAPALVALSGWVRDDQELAQRALTEALRRDDFKTSLFFGLVTRRANRREANGRWIQRYLRHQDPTALDREFIILLNAIANGIFGVEVRELASATIDAWLKQLGARAGFQEDQEARWREAFTAREPVVPEDEYRVLRQFSPTWPKLQQSLSRGRRSGVVIGDFRAVFEGEIVASPELVREVDGILDSLVKNFDDEELPLRRQDRLLELILDTNGDRPLAQQRFDAEQHALDEKMPFTQLLTNASMSPNLAQASRATQRFSIALSREWIVRAQEGLTARDRSQVPQQVELQIGDWHGICRDGSEEQALRADIGELFGQKLKKGLKAIKRPAFFYPALLLGLAALMLGQFGFFVLAAAALYCGLEERKVRARKARLRADLAETLTRTDDIMRAALAELVDYRREWAKEDTRAEELRELVLAISPRECTFVQPGDARQVVMTRAS